MGRLLTYLVLTVAVAAAAMRFAVSEPAVGDGKPAGTRCEIVGPSTSMQEMYGLISSCWQSDMAPVHSGLFAAKTAAPVVRVNPYARFAADFTPGLPAQSGDSPVVRLLSQRDCSRRYASKLERQGYYVVGLRKIII